jgi:hypothetical protein
MGRWAGRGGAPSVAAEVAGLDGSKVSGDAMNASQGRKAHLARNEADLAYFQARLELLGEPATSNQTAQRTVFMHLYQQLSDRVEEERQAPTKAFSVEGLFDG